LDSYDLVVTGVGPAGEKAAAQAAYFGKRVVATELVHIGQAVIHLDGTVDAFIEMVFNFPSLAEAYKYAAYDCLGELAKAP
jgi:pyruvate/2-oxoglutarate dehydrogenase complex dihydrolipoamide dehydrogenase (E3) component